MNMFCRLAYAGEVTGLAMVLAACGSSSTTAGAPTTTVRTTTVPAASNTAVSPADSPAPPATLAAPPSGAAASTSEASHPTDAPAVTVAPAGGGAPIKGTVGGACHLITEQEASTAIGSAAGPGDEQGNTALSHCDWADGSLAITLVANGKPTFDHVVASLKAVNNNGRWSAVHGLGTDAVVTHGGPLAMVYFMRGATLVNVILSGPGETARPDAAVIVARAAAGRL